MKKLIGGGIACNTFTFNILLVIPFSPKATKLSNKVKKLIACDELKDRHAEVLLKYPHTVQNKLADAIIKHKIPSSKVRDFTKLYDVDPKRNLDDIASSEKSEVKQKPMS